MSALLSGTLSCCLSSKSITATKHGRPLMKSRSSSVVPVKACFRNPFEQEPVLKEALKEPVAFMGGVFAGLLRLDLNDDPLKDWVKRSVEASGLTEEEVVGSGSGEAEDEVPQQINIE